VRVLMISTLTALSLATSSNRRPRQPKLPYQDRTRYNDISIQIPRRYHRSNGFKSNCRQLDCESDGQEGHRDQQLFTGYNGWWCCCESNPNTTASNGVLSLKRCSSELVLMCLIGLPILARIPRHAMSTARTPTQASYIRCGCLENPRQSRLLLQRNGSIYGHNVCRGDTLRRSGKCRSSENYYFLRISLGVVYSRNSLDIDTS
jgi:hypothetical protein